MCESPMDGDAPVMLAWATFKATEAYENAARWAVSPQDTEGALWRAFLEGYTAAASAPPSDAAPSLDALAIEADNFARTTFPSRSAESISEHLRREAIELAAAPNDAEEMADVFILLGNLVHFTGTDLNAAVVAKLAKNRARKWGKPDAHGVVEHVRETLPADAATEAVRELLRRCDEVLLWVKFEDGVPVEWPEAAVIASCRSRIERALSPAPAPSAPEVKP